jgi:hypothetical protein
LTAVRVAKVQGYNPFQKLCSKMVIKKPEQSIKDSVADFFDEKVKRLVCETVVNTSTYNGKSKLQVNTALNH